MKLSRRVLHHVAKPVDFRYPVKNQLLAEQMRSLMLKEQGIGLAATQIGITQRVFVMQIAGVFRACFNPEIVESSDILVNYTEGCLSFLGDQCIITRPDWVKVKYQTHNGDVIEEQLQGLEATCFQHELDHLNGITMWDRHKEQHAEQSGN